MYRPDWISMFLIDAFHWAQRSHDQQTKHGCIFVRDYTIISHGYNGIIRNIDNNVLPLTRPEKYPYMIHAEQNALFNCCRNGVSTLNAHAFITGQPCTDCLQYMYQAGIKRIFYTDLVTSNMIDVEQEERFKLLCNLIKHQTEVTFVPKNLINIKHLDRLYDAKKES